MVIVHIPNYLLRCGQKMNYLNLFIEVESTYRLLIYELYLYLWNEHFVAADSKHYEYLIFADDNSLMLDL